MQFLRLAQEGGPLAYLAIALGGLGLALGLLSLVLVAAKSQAALTMGIVTLLCASAAAGTGMLGTVNGRRGVDRALSAVRSRVDAERIRRQGYQEAQAASLLGFGASLLPGLMGLAAALIGARIRRPPRRVQGVLEIQAADEGNGMLVLAGVFGAIALLAAGGAWSMARAPIPPGLYPFAVEDTDSWELASALEHVEDDPAQGCRMLHHTLLRFWRPGLTETGPAERDEWPRRFAREPDQSLDRWKLSAELCTRRLADDSHPDELTREELLESPILRDEAVRNELLSRERSAETGKATAVDRVAGDEEGGLSRGAIQRVLRDHLKEIRLCYERELVKDRKLEGTVTVNFTIGATGAVSEARDESPTPFPNAAVSRCVVGRFKAMVFPRPNGGGEVSVAYPLVFRPAE